MQLGAFLLLSHFTCISHHTVLTVLPSILQTPATALPDMDVGSLRKTGRKAEEDSHAGILAKDALVRQDCGCGSGLVWSHHQTFSGCRMKEINRQMSAYIQGGIPGKLPVTSPFLLVQCPHIHQQSMEEVPRWMNDIQLQSLRRHSTQWR